MPGFLDPSTWEYVCTLREPTTPLPGFNRPAAEASIRFNGFYLFEAGVTAPPSIPDLALGCVIGATRGDRRCAPERGSAPWTSAGVVPSALSTALTPRSTSSVIAWPRSGREHQAQSSRPRRL